VAGVRERNGGARADVRRAQLGGLRIEATAVGQRAPAGQPGAPPGPPDRLRKDGFRSPTHKPRRPLRLESSRKSRAVPGGGSTPCLNNSWGAVL
jgi:hypothetical protein